MDLTPAEAKKVWHEAAEKVKDKVIARELDNIRVKGKNKPVLIYELLDVPEGLEPPAKAN